MLRFRCLIFSLLATLSAFSQKGDTLRKYLDQDYSLSKRGRAVYPALAIRKDDHWMLIATYPDTSLLLVAWFKDKNLTIKDGPYSFYYGNGKQYVQGYFVNNLPMGGWQYWYANGVLKDSGVIQNGQMVQTWKSWHENGSLMAIGNYKFDSSIVVLPAADGYTSSLLPKPDVISRTKHGTWASYFPSGNLYDSGEYVNNRKNGYWRFWRPGALLEAEGYFVNDTLTGEWNWYGENGKRSTREFYKASKLVKMECYDENGEYTGDFCSILKPPYPLGDFRDFQNYMMDNIQFPKELINKELKGDVTIQCEISKDGKLNKLNVVSPYPSLTQEVEKFFNTLTNWSPAIVHNRPVQYTIEYKLPLTAE